MSCPAFLIFVYHAQLKKVMKYNHVYEEKNKQGEEAKKEEKRRVRNNSHCQVREEGASAPGARDEIPLQPMEKTTPEQTSLLLPMKQLDIS